MSGSRRPDANGQATVGTVLVIALVVVGSTVVLTLGNQALTDTERRSDVERAERAMTTFATQTTQVARGDADARTVRFGRTAGTYHVDEAAGEISIINVDRDDDGVDDDGDIDPTTGGANNDDEYILSPTTLGAVVYENAGRTIAYQGGGVWTRDERGGARMISPPPFHYRGRTPMLPVVGVTGAGDAGGSARATVSKGDVLARSVYPNASRSFDDGDPFLNPVQNGSIVVRIESAYARAWGAYFETRTDGVVSYPSDGVVTVELVSPPRPGGFDMPLEGGSLTVDGTARAHSVTHADAGGTAFSIRLRPDDADSAKFSNLQWSLYADEGDREFEIHLRKAGGGDDCKDGSTSVGAHVTIYYSWNGGEDYHGWVSKSPVEADCADLDGDGDEEIYLDVTFVDDDDADSQYDDYEALTDLEFDFQSLSPGQLEHFHPDGDLDASTLDGHSAGWEPDSPTTRTYTADMLVAHYFAELPDGFALRVDDEGGDTVDEDASSGVLHTTTGDEHVTYLHVTLDRVEVEVEAEN